MTLLLHRSIQHVKGLNLFEFINVKSLLVRVDLSRFYCHSTHKQRAVPGTFSRVF
eukprot:IDg12610t1